MKFALIVSHELGVQESLRMILKDDFSVLQATTGSEAVALVAHHPVDVALIEPTLPDYKGLSLLERLREVSEDICFVLVSAAREHDQLAATNGYPDYEVLGKPFDREEVRWVLRKALDHARLTREVRMLKSRMELNGGGRYVSVPFRDDYLVPSPPAPWQLGEKDSPSIQFALKEFFKALTHITDMDRLLDFVLHAISEMFQVNKAVILLFEQGKSQFRVKASLGIEETRLRNLVFRLGEGLPGWLLRYNQILRKEDVELSGFTREGALVLEQLEALDAKISTPLLTKGKLVGILCLGNKVTGRTYSEGDVELLSMVGNYTAIAVENSLLYRELALQKKYNENILKSIASGVIAIDNLGRITTYNPNAERILAIPREEVVGRSVQKLGSVFADILLRTLDGNEAFCRHEIAHPMTKAPLGISTSRLRDEANRIKGAIMTFTDLTESKELESKTKDLERLRFWSALANRMAQEIRNPLVAVKTFAQLLPERYSDEEFRQSFFSVVMGEVDRLNKITECLMEFAQPRENRFDRADLHEIIHVALQAKEELLKARNTRVVKQIPSEPVYVIADRAHLEKAISHILDNSLEAMPEAGRLRLKTQRVRHSMNGKPATSRLGREWVEILIEDSGTGIPREHLPDIFSPFFTTKIKGMGFGLPIAQRVIQDHRGRIEVESEPGKGSKVKIFMPVDVNGGAGAHGPAEPRT
jgi:two-component system sensor histidine kinase AtoS